MVADEPRYDLALAARFRAAFGYKGMKQAAIAEALGVSKRTVHRLETGRAEIDLVMQRTVIRLTGVPSWFVEHGFAPPVETGAQELREQLARVEAELAELGEDLLRQLEQSEGRLRVELREAVGGNRPEPGGEDQP